MEEGYVLLLYLSLPYKEGGHAEEFTGRKPLK